MHTVLAMKQRLEKDVFMRGRLSVPRTNFTDRRPYLTDFDIQHRLNTQMLTFPTIVTVHQQQSSMRTKKRSINAEPLAPLAILKHIHSS
jgi:hypothetical protein